MSLFALNRRTALVTGGTRGIGLAIATELGEAGAAIVVSSESAADCASAAEQLRERGIEAHGVVCDVSDRAQVESLAARASQLLNGCIDILICNAGIAGPAGPMGEATETDWDRVMTINLRSVWWLTSLIIPGMAERGEGSVIVTASLSALRGNKAIGVYGVSKAGLLQLVRNLAVEWSPRNVRINAISPGVIRTEFSRPIVDDDARSERRLQLTPLRRFGSPEEVAGVALMLASPAGGFITGQNIVVDGGTLISDGN